LHAGETGVADPRQLLSDWLEPKNHRADHGLNERDVRADPRGDHGGDHGEWGRCIKRKAFTRVG